MGATQGQVKQATVAGQARLLKAVGRGPWPVSLPKSTDIGVLAPDRDMATEEVRLDRIK